MMAEKVSSPSEITSEILKISVIHVVNQVLQESIIGNDWCDSIIGSCYKYKGDGLNKSIQLNRGLNFAGQAHESYCKNYIARLVRKRISLDKIVYSGVREKYY